MRMSQLGRECCAVLWCWGLTASWMSLPCLQAGQLSLQALPDYAALVKSGGEVTDVTVAAMDAPRVPEEA